MSSTNTAVEYYDLIAERYDELMSDDKPNTRVRAIVRDYFCKTVPIGEILDFGAGTGLDLGWQLDSGYSVVFYEPSANMAKEAEKNFSVSEKPAVRSMIGKEANPGEISRLPDNSLEAVFSNFAALNSVKNLAEVFAVFAKKLKPGGHLICVLTHNFNTISRLKAAVLNKGRGEAAVSRMVEYKEGQSMPVYFHSIGSLKKCAKQNHLSFEHNFDLDFEKHEVTHFIKK